MIMNNDDPKHRNEPTRNRPDTEVSEEELRRRLYDVLLPGDFSHEEAEAQLPLYVTDELLGRPVHKLYPRLHRHLLHCRQCFDLYADMMQDLTEEDAVIVAVPKPDLDFLSQLSASSWEARWTDLRSVTKEALQTIVASTWPQIQEEISIAIRILFRQLDQLGDDIFLQANPAQALGFGAEDIPLSQRLALATYKSNRAMQKTLRVEEGSLDSLFPDAVFIIAQNAAEAAGLSPEESENFVHSYLAWLRKTIS